jgi:hypothetical protein
MMMSSGKSSVDARAILLVLRDPANLPCGNIGLQTFQRSCFTQNTYGILQLYDTSEEEKERGANCFLATRQQRLRWHSSF